MLPSHQTLILLLCRRDHDLVDKIYAYLVRMTMTQALTNLFVPPVLAHHESTWATMSP